MGQLLLSAIRGTGSEVELVGRLRTWDGHGDTLRQQRLRDISRNLSRRLIRRYSGGQQGPDLWFTYHVYHKAPDWIGPEVSTALNIPYVIAEASYAPKQQDGPWGIGHAQCRAGIERADAIINLNDQDLPCLQEIVGSACRMVTLKPFMAVGDIDAAPARARSDVARDWSLPEDVPWLICVAMKRAGDKLASFAQLARVLGNLGDQRWHMIVVGDGEARQQVARMFEPLRSRTTMMGQLDTELVYAMLKSSDVYVWPAVNEAYGMALLEAQACGLPVVAAAVGGVPQIVTHERTGLLSPMDDVEAFTRHLRLLIAKPELRRQMGMAASLKCRREHDTAQAVRVLNSTFSTLVQ